MVPVHNLNVPGKVFLKCHRWPVSSLFVNVKASAQQVSQVWLKRIEGNETWNGRIHGRGDICSGARACGHDAVPSFENDFLKPVKCSGLVA